MKTRNLLVLLMTVIAMLLSGCSKEESKYKELMIGTWDGISVKSQNEWIDITPDYLSKFHFSITFHENGTYYGTGYFGTGYGTYSIKKNTIITYVDGKEYYRYDIIDISNNIAHIKMYETSGNSSIEIKVKKR